MKSSITAVNLDLVPLEMNELKTILYDRIDLHRNGRIEFEDFVQLFNKYISIGYPELQNRKSMEFINENLTYRSTWKIGII